jgi:hypothetical protein
MVESAYVRRSDRMTQPLHFENRVISIKVKVLKDLLGRRGGTLLQPFGYEPDQQIRPPLLLKFP